MKKIILTPMEENKYNIIKELVDHSGNKRRAALKLNCYIRTINRLIACYKSEGKYEYVQLIKKQSYVLIRIAFSNFFKWL